jgi:hypothetical protein
LLTFKKVKIDVASLLKSRQSLFQAEPVEFFNTLTFSEIIVSSLSKYFS